MGKTYLIFNQVESLKDILKEINSVSAEQSEQGAIEIFDLKNSSSLSHY